MDFPLPSFLFVMEECGFRPNGLKGKDSNSFVAFSVSLFSFLNQLYGQYIYQSAVLGHW